MVSFKIRVIRFYTLCPYISEFFVSWKPFNKKHKSMNNDTSETYILISYLCSLMLHCFDAVPLQSGIEQILTIVMYSQRQ